jgi:hypothetical protein
LKEKSWKNLRGILENKLLKMNFGRLKNSLEFLLFFTSEFLGATPFFAKTIFFSKSKFFPKNKFSQKRLFQKQIFSKSKFFPKNKFLLVNSLQRKK